MSLRATFLSSDARDEMKNKSCISKFCKLRKELRVTKPILNLYTDVECAITRSNLQFSNINFSYS